MPIRKRPSKKTKSGYTYQVYFPYVDSMGVNRRFTKSGFLTKKEAQDFEAMKRQEIKDYGDNFGNVQITFNEVFMEYMEVEGKKYAPSTIQYYLSSYELYIKKSIGQRKILSLRYRDIQRFFNEFKCNYSTAKNVKKVFGVTYSYAQKNGYVKENPMKLVTLYTQKNGKKTAKDQIITRDQLNTIIDNILVMDKHCPDYDYSQFNSYSFAVALYIGWFTGLRISETLGLKKEDIDLENSCIHVRRRVEYHQVSKKSLYTTEKLKTNASKATIPLAKELKEILIKWFEKNPYDYVVCDIYGELIHPYTFQARIREVNLKTGFHFNYHMLRHSFTTALIKNGIKPSVTKELVRHSNISTTLDIYTHVLEDDKSDAVNKVFG